MIKITENDRKDIVHLSFIPDSGAEKSRESVSFKWMDETVLTQTELAFLPKKLFRYVCDGDPVVRKKMTANGEVSYIENMETVPDGSAYTVKLKFMCGRDELLLGLGQYEDGIINHRNSRVYIYESNMRIGIPFLLTTGHYGILIDSESSVIFESRDDEIEFTIDTAYSLSYYVFLGSDPGEIIKLLYEVTGMPSMLPAWVFGYIQSRERYRTEKELINIADGFRSRNIPVDCIVQDWYSWGEGLWGNKTFDSSRYPDLPSAVRHLHDSDIHFMVSIWPNMSPDCNDYREFKKAGKLLPNSNVYDAFDEEARALYWSQCRKQIMESGTDALWCDNSEPFSDADWSGERKKPEEERYRVVTDTSRMSMKWDKLNSYSLYHAQGIYENWRRDYPGKRVVNLTRSGYTGSWKYGTILWSGDITASFDTMKKQIAEGINASLSGIVYWTLDIGGFFVVDDKYENRGCNDREHKPLWFWHGDYNEGVNDPAYRELYVRWLQFGTFLPVFRSHGTDTPREPWQFGEEGDVFYDTIVDYISLRYRLFPYIYSLAAAAHMKGEIMMRSLVMDFPGDEEAGKICDEYMFGPAFLVAPVTEHMYYRPGSVAIDNVPKKRSVYLPKGCGWYDYYTGEYHEGGTRVLADAVIEKMPLFVRAGSVIPMAVKSGYRSTENLQGDTIMVYKGGDCVFQLYSDSGDGYDFEKGDYSLTTLRYSEKDEVLYADDIEVPDKYDICYIG